MKKLLSSMLVLTLITSVGYGATTIIVDPAHQDDKGLALALKALGDVLASGKVVFAAGGELPATGDVVTLGIADAQASDWQAPDPDAYRIRVRKQGDRRVVAVQAAGKRGLMFGTFKLAEEMRLGGDLDEGVSRHSPAFPMRMYSELGQLLNIPDLNYYSDEAPYVNEERLKREIAEAKQLVDHVASLGFNTITFLHVNAEDYIDYRHLDKEIYPADSRHRQRSPVFCRYLKELCDYAHERHLEIYLQLYEFQYPQELNKKYNLDLRGPDMEKIISAKCRELFERVPLDGLVITPTESHPRCGYKSANLWKRYGLEGAGRMLSLYHKACQASGARAVFRLWRVTTNAEGAKQAAAHIPTDAMFSVKNTGSDFWLNYPLTDVVTQDVGEVYPLMVVFDPFRQYDGWGSAFCYMEKYGRRMRLCSQHSVQAINAWGAWSPGCIWPTFEPGYLRSGGKHVPWAGFWNDFRVFTRGFSAGQANVYLMARLAWESEADPREVARDFVHLHLGAANAAAGAEALMATEAAWAEMYPGERRSTVSPVYFKWAMVFGPRKRDMDTFYKNYSLPKLLDSNRHALERIEAMESSFAETDRSAAPDKEVYDRFARAIDLTAVTIRTYCLYREWFWRGRATKQLQGEAQEKNAQRLRKVHAELQDLIRDDWSDHPLESSYWRITYRHGGEPEVHKRGVFPRWWIFDCTLEKLVNGENK